MKKASKGVNPQQLMQHIAQMLQHGMTPQAIIQQLVQSGIPQQEAAQLCQQVASQIQQSQSQNQGPVQQQDPSVGQEPQSMNQPQAKDGIHIKASHKGLFTKKANHAGESVQAFASHVLANKSKYSISTIKQANFAHNAVGWHKAEEGFEVERNIYPLAKDGIHINPANKGKFTATKKATGKSTEELTHSKNPITKKRAIFAQNASHWSHKKAENGLSLEQGKNLEKHSTPKYPGGGQVDRTNNQQSTNLFNTNKQKYVDSTLNAHKDLNWVQRLYGNNQQSIQIPGEPYRSTHLMSDDGNGYIFPRIQYINGKLVDLGSKAEDYARESNSGIQLPKQQGTWFADNGYKEGTGVLPSSHYQTPPQDMPGYLPHLKNGGNIKPQDAKKWHHKKALDGLNVDPQDGLVNSTFQDQKLIGTNMPQDPSATSYAFNTGRSNPMNPLGAPNPMLAPQRNPMMSQPVQKISDQPLAPPNSISTISPQDPTQTTNPNVKAPSMGSSWKDLAGSGGKTILAGLSLVDALLPAEKINRKYLRPEDLPTENQHPYGTGSQALMKNGGKMKGKKFKAFYGAIIGAAQQAGDSVVQGMNETNQALMGLANYHNKDLQEQNLAASQGYNAFQNTNNLKQFPTMMTMKKGGNVPKYPEGGSVDSAQAYLQQQIHGTPSYAPNLNSTSVVNNPIVDNKGRQAWNGYVGWLKQKGLAGSPTLDHNGLGQKMLGQYMQENPKSGLTPDNVVPIQQDFQNYRTWSLQGLQNGTIKPDGDTSPNNFMTHLSKVDGYPGQYTTKYTFPDAYLKQFDVNGNPSTSNVGKATQQTFKQGGFIPKAADGLQVEDNMIKPISDQTMQFEGPSHANGGIQASYAGKPFEAEGGEPIAINNEGAAVIFGNLKNPVTGSKFKYDAKQIAKKEAKNQKTLDLGTSLVNNTNTDDPFERLSFNSGNAMMQGSYQKIQELSASKEHLGDLQQAAQALEDEKNPKKAKKGMTIKKYGSGGKPGDPTDPSESEKYFTPLLAKERLRFQAEHPGHKAQVNYNSLGENRTPEQQQAIVANWNKQHPGKKSPYPSFSMHNVGGARDFNFSLDGQPVGPNSSEYNQLHQDAQSMGLFPLSGNMGKTDPYHIGLVQEGMGHTARDFYNKFPDAKNWNESQSYFQSLQSSINNGTATQAQLNAYKAYSGNNPNVSVIPDASVQGNINLPANQQLVGEDALTRAINNKLQLAPDYIPNTPMNTPSTNYNDNAVFHNPQAAPVQGKSKFAGLGNMDQFLGEAYSLATNREQPVKAQLYQPDLFQPYQISMQDSINENNGEFNGIQKQLAYDPTALSSLAAQRYQANDKIKADEFRTNQEISNDIVNKNINLLNNAKEQNLNILDQQYVRQTDAKAATRKDNLAALNSISGKLLQQKADENQLNVYKNLYPNVNFNANGVASDTKDGMSYINTYSSDRGTGINPEAPMPLGLNRNLTKSEQILLPNGQVKQTTNTYGFNGKATVPKFAKGGKEEPKQKTFSDMMKKLKQ